MKGRQIAARIMVLGMLLAWLNGPGLAQGPQETATRGELSIESAVNSEFSYQGVLKENGKPVTGSREMVFRLYSDDACTTQVGSNIVKSGVQVAGGLFSVELAVSHGAFNGQGLWLEVEVDGSQIGCQEILPVPYALSLRPGAVIQGVESSVELTHRLEGFRGEEYGVRAVSEGPEIDTDYRGVYGFGSTAGVYGESSGGVGVHGISSSGIGVFAESGGPVAIYGNGDFEQDLDGNGLVKAAVHLNCNNDQLLGCTRSFNNVSGTVIVCSPGTANGRCTIDLGFDISDRFWVATAVGNYGYGVTCQLGSSNRRLDCIRFSASDGIGLDGKIMVLVY